MVGLVEQEQLLLSLSCDLANNDKPVESRRLAGMMLVDVMGKEAAYMWVSMDRMIKSQIKDLLLKALVSSEARQASTSSQVIAKIASLEIPLKQWPELFKSLLGNMTHQSAQVKQSTLETLCYVCQEVVSDPPLLVNHQVNDVIRAVLRGSLPSEPSEVRLAATKALLNVLCFAQANFGNEMECRLILRVVYNAALSREVEIREVAFQCFVFIASKYYEVLGRDCGELFEITLKAINGDVHTLALQAIAFWNSICDVEMERNPHSDLIKYNIPHLIPILLEVVDQEDNRVDVVMNIIPKLLSHILQKIAHTLQIDGHGREKQQAILLASLCGLVQFMVEKLSGADKTKHLVLQNADAIMTLFLRVLAFAFAFPHGHAGGEAMLATGALACATGPAFQKYVPDLFKYLKLGLENFEECSITVGLVGDICRALDDKILPFCDQIMSLLTRNLQSDALPKSVKPLMFNCIGDIALAIGVHFSERYLTPALVEIMQGAAAEVCAQSDEELRKCLLEAYSGILQGCGDAKAQVMIMQYLIDLNAQMAEGVVVQAAVVATGDLADALDKRQSSC